jgi:hypothetical protein
MKKTSKKSKRGMNKSLLILSLSLILLIAVGIMSWHLYNLSNISQNFQDVDFVTSVETDIFGTEMVVNMSENDFVQNKSLLTSSFEKVANDISHQKNDVYSIFFPYRVRIVMKGGFSNKLKNFSTEFVDIFHDCDTYVINIGSQYVVEDLPIILGPKNKAVALNVYEAKDLYIRSQVLGLNPSIKSIKQ